ncbi:D-alanyl-D-alanine carboxypeptidase [Flavobacteriaceae bacterium MAR_2010_188]|nr:D-alanyl-D-alanine carboxypeptidase [Flavobacteriaceae bacterium MAR_2010_188]
MKRRTFVKSSALTTLAVSLLPKITFAALSETITDEELLGKAHLNFRNENLKLRNEAYECFNLMKEEALVSNIKIEGVSAFRSYEDQKRIWNRKFLAYTKDGLLPMDAIHKIVEYSTMPGTSRHHWGTDIDLIDGAVNQPKNVLSPQHFKNNGPFVKFKQWMENNSERFGFYLVYTNLESRKGFKYEPWHYSYKPLSDSYLKHYRERDIFQLAKSSDIEGVSHLSDDFLSQYYQENILDINPELL